MNNSTSTTATGPRPQELRAGAGPVVSAAVLGLGAMGARIADRLLAAGIDVAVWNRTPGPWPSGARHADSPADAARGADVVLVCVRATTRPPPWSGRHCARGWPTDGFTPTSEGTVPYFHVADRQSGVRDAGTAAAR